MPAACGMFALGDGVGLVAKQVRYVNDEGGSARLRLKSASPDHNCLAEDVHIVGKVLRTVRWVMDVTQVRYP